MLGWCVAVYRDVHGGTRDTPAHVQLSVLIEQVWLLCYSAYLEGHIQHGVEPHSIDLGLRVCGSVSALRGHAAQP